MKNVELECLRCACPICREKDAKIDALAATLATIVDAIGRDEPLMAGPIQVLDANAPGWRSR
jgi:hypothetical protein